MGVTSAIFPLWKGEWVHDWSKFPVSLEDAKDREKIMMPVDHYFFFHDAKIVFHPGKKSLNKIQDVNAAEDSVSFKISIPQGCIGPQKGLFVLRAKEWLTWRKCTW